MDLQHTHRTHQVRKDYELAAISLMAALEQTVSGTTSTIDEMETKYRGMDEYEKALGKLADWLRTFNQSFRAKPHDCKGQGCS